MNGNRRQSMFRCNGKHHFLLAIITLTLFSINMIQAQGIKYSQGPYDQRPSYGLFVDLNYNSHAASFKGEEWIPCDNCSPGFEAGKGIGFSIGGFYAMPVMKDWDLTLRLGLTGLNALLSSEEPMVVPIENGGYENGIFTHELDASISSIGLTPMLSYHATEQILVHLGFRAGYIMSASFAQKEEIKEPSNGTFENGKRTRNEFSGEIENKSTLDFAGVFGVSYSLPISASFEWFIEPEAYYSLGVTSLASGLSWRANSLMAGVALRYSPRETIVPVLPPKEAPLPPLPAPPLPPSFNAFITAVSVEEDGTESEVSQIKVDEFLSRRIHPLLNYGFFDEGSATIPERYSRMTETEKAEFSPNFLANLKTMQVYYQVLNIVGNRMKRFPNTTLNLIGCNSNMGVEAGNTELSRKRAQTVKDFLIKEWEIDPERITVEARNLPEIPSNQTRKEGIEENRRVEFKTDFNDILFEPITVRDTIRNTNPPRLRFKPRVTSEVGVKSWKVETYQGNSMLKVFEGKGEPPQQLELNLQEEQEYVPLLNEDYKYKLIVVDNDNKTWESQVQSMKVEPLTIEHKFDKLISGEEVDARDFDRFSLISFEFNKSDLTKEHQPIIQLAKKRIMPNSKVDIEGRSDNTGDPARNMKLSKERADNTADGLNVDKKFAKGFGANNPFYSNDIPEGRFYNRTVYIQIETKIELEE